MNAMIEEPKSALEHLRRGVNPITAAKLQQRQQAEFKLTLHLQSAIKDAMRHISPEWSDEHEKLSERLAVQAFQRLRNSMTLEDCEQIFTSIL